MPSKKTIYISDFYSIYKGLVLFKIERKASTYIKGKIVQPCKDKAIRTLFHSKTLDKSGF